jgi:hypothetical protein
MYFEVHGVLRRQGSHNDRARKDVAVMPSCCDQSSSTLFSPGWASFTIVPLELMVKQCVKTWRRQAQDWCMRVRALDISRGLKK